MRYYCQPCDHRWWQHRDPDPTIRLIGLAMMFVGAIELGVGLAVLLKG